MEGEAFVKNSIKSENVDIKIIIPHVYGNVRYDFSCGAGIELEGKYLGYDGAKSYDYSAKIDYKLVKGLRLEGGYKEIGLDIPDEFANDYDLTTSFNYTFSGPYAGLSYVF